jgi:membrane carboxypeptidase/penicillin-binding protein PbpC
VSLLELTNAYAALARGGEYQPVGVGVPFETDNLESYSPSTLFVPPQVDQSTSVGLPCISSDPKKNCRDSKSELNSFSKEKMSQAAFMVTSILSDPEARRLSFGDTISMNLDNQPVAIKTGTSHSSKDVWAVGYTPYYSVGIWVGHTDNSPMPGFTGAQVAVPVWHRIMQNLHNHLPPLPFNVPEGMQETPFCQDEACKVVKLDWAPQDEFHHSPSPHVPLPEESFRFIAPVDGDQFLIDLKEKLSFQQITCKLRVPKQVIDFAVENKLPIEWKVNGLVVATSPVDNVKNFISLAPGKHEIGASVGKFKTKVVRITVSDLKD